MTSKIYHLKLLKRGQEVVLVRVVEQGEREGWVEVQNEDGQTQTVEEVVEEVGEEVEEEDG